MPGPVPIPRDTNVKKTSLFMHSKIYIEHILYINHCVRYWQMFSKGSQASGKEVNKNLYYRMIKCQSEVIRKKRDDLSRLWDAGKGPWKHSGWSWDLRDRESERNPVTSTRKWEDSYQGSHEGPKYPNICGVIFQPPSSWCLKLQIVQDPMQTMFFPTHTYLW